jgi:hypothetical protein
MAGSWDEVEELLLALADEELRRGYDPAMACLVAFAGEDLRFLAFLRPFPRGAYHAPLIELLALAGPLGSDRLAFASTGRAWSLDDPIPPVTEDADLRQRVLMIQLVDGTSGPPSHRSVVLPFDDGPDGAPVWGPRHEHEAVEGWIAEVLRVAVGAELRARLPAGDAAVAAQARRCLALGHALYLAEDLEQRITRAPLAAVGGRHPLVRSRRHGRRRR